MSHPEPTHDEMYWNEMELKARDEDMIDKGCEEEE